MTGKRGGGFAERIELLRKAVGSQRALARWLGVKDPTIIAWRGGSEPFESTIRKISNRTGLDLQWLRDGKGDQEEQLKLAREAARSSSPKETARAPLNQTLSYILEHGTESDVAFLESVLEAALTQIQKRQSGK